MPHKASLSLEFNSSLTSINTKASVKRYQEQKSKIEAIVNSEANLQALVNTAEQLVNQVLAPDPTNKFTYRRGRKEASVPLDQVMLAMLASVEECGGKAGKRYVAGAISSCSEEKDKVGALAALGTTWLTHLLFNFKTGSHSWQLTRTLSEGAAPTGDTTAPHFLGGVGHRKTSFAEDVIKRDGYQCVITGHQARLHPRPTTGARKAPLAAARILRRAVGEFDKDHKSDSYKSAATTFDILRNFARLPTATLENLATNLDDPSNGISLEPYAHDAFELYEWCLKATETENVYTLRIYQEGVLLRDTPTDHRITFADHSDDFPDRNDKKRTAPPVNLPDPCYIAIHAAVAGVLHMSGAGKFFDELLGDFKDDDDKVSAVRCWSDLECLMEEVILREAVHQLFSDVG